MSQEEGRRAPVNQSYFHSPNPDLDLTGKLYKREVGGKPYSVLVDNKMAAKASAADQNIGHVTPQQHQQYFREGGAGQEVETQGPQAGNNGTSDDTEEDDDEDEEEEGEDEDAEEEEEEGFKREQIIVEVNLNNQTLHVSKGDSKTGTTADDSDRAGSDDEEEDEEEEE
ncbi:hypothetical protein F2P81_015352 [Scophthalmus maximus]|uniref:Uncharacterized protein n=3 Tax=Scophthalmus maximus TaxID=52904 RepID=A0A6A4SS35_SCOMX|nr:hypothetical protein F2P81_015352 [Scophthalmus maximus]